jgi:hypothetical protein
VRDAAAALSGERRVANGVVHVRVLRLRPIDPEAGELGLRDERLNSRRMLLIGAGGFLNLGELVDEARERDLGLLGGDRNPGLGPETKN